MSSEPSLAQDITGSEMAVNLERRPATVLQQAAILKRSNNSVSRCLAPIYPPARIKQSAIGHESKRPLKIYFDEVERPFRADSDVHLYINDSPIFAPALDYVSQSEFGYFVVLMQLFDAFKAVVMVHDAFHARAFKMRGWGAA
jgi:hypothetical protein